MHKILQSALLLVSTLTWGCSATSDDTGGQQTQASLSDQVVTLRFAADNTVSQSGPLFAGTRVRVVYDEGRMPTCRGEQFGLPAWTVTGFYRINSGDVQQFLAAGYVPVEPRPEFVLPEKGELELWFRNNNRWGCEAWDSAEGKNFHFEIKSPAGAPGWIGNAFSVISRETCEGSFCPQDRVSLDQGFRWGTWERERAAIGKAYFEVYEPGVTDWENPDVWKQLAVQLHHRFGATSAFAASYINIDGRVGNNVRYGFDLRQLDPFAPITGTISDPKECPLVPLRVSPEGQFVETELEFYVSVNNAELRPKGDVVYRGIYADHVEKYSVCLKP